MPLLRVYLHLAAAALLHLPARNIDHDATIDLHLAGKLLDDVKAHCSLPQRRPYRGVRRHDGLPSSEASEVRCSTRARYTQIVGTAASPPLEVHTWLPQST